MIEITKDLQINDDELTFTAARSGGPGGQHVNKVNSRITLRFDVATSPSLDDAQRARLRERLPTRITKDGVLWVHAARHRSQRRNRDAAVERFVELLQSAFEVERPRRPTKTPRRAHARRIEAKRRRGAVKRDRRTRYDPGKE